MTTNQKFVAEKLLQGFYLVRSGPHWYRLRSPEHLVVRKISDKSFQAFQSLLREKKNLFFLNRSKVRQLHGNHYLKQLYKSKMSTHATKKPSQQSAGAAGHLSTTATHLQVVRLHR